jgi:hypothetical protein
MRAGACLAVKQGKCEHRVGRTFGCRLAVREDGSTRSRSLLHGQWRHVPCGLAGTRRVPAVGAGTPSIPGIAQEQEKLLDPVKHPAARLDSRGGSDPLTSRKALEFGVRCHLRRHTAQLCYRVCLGQPLAQLVDFLYSVNRFQDIPAGWRRRGYRRFTGVSLSMTPI